MCLHDRYLEAAVGDLFDHDDRLRGLRVEVRFDGGVAHVDGDVADPADLSVVREVIGRLAGVYAVWDRVRVADREPVVVDIGCGETKQYPGNIGMDIQPTSAVDVLADAGRSLPFADASVDRLFAVHVLEHLPDYLPLLDECHRVLRPDGVLHVLGPWWGHVNAVADPTHVRLLDVQTIKGICRRRGSPVRWHPLHAGCDGASVFADLAPLHDGQPDPDKTHLARFFD
jgi:SAM-dependent methyltransferase